MIEESTWKAEAEELFGETWWGDRFGIQLAMVAGLQYAFSLGEQRVILDRRDALWSPGCGFTATQRLVECQWCNHVYRAISETSIQGDDCCAWMWIDDKDGLLLQAGYGSCHDTYRYRATPRCRYADLGLTFPLDPICDRCIDGMLAKGDLELASDGHL